MNTKTKTAIIYVSLIVLLLAMVQTASARSTYYYTDDTFKEKFGEVAPVREVARKYGRTLYVDSDAFYRKFGSGPFVTLEKKPFIISGDVQVGDTVTLPEASVTEPIINIIENDTEDIPVVVIPIERTGTNDTTENDTIIIDIVNDTVAVASNDTTDTAENDTNETAGTDTDEPEIIVVPGDVGDDTPDEVPDDVPTDAPAENDSEIEVNDTETTGAVIAGGDDESLQITIIGFLIVVIVVMLVVLLTREESSEGKPKKKNSKPAKGKDDWEEGAFFKEAKAKTANKTAAKQAPKAAAKPKVKEKKDVKPFLLKIKDEV